MALLQFDYLFWLNPAKANAAGACPISLRLTLGGQRTEVSTQLRCTPGQWDARAHRLAKGRAAHPAAKDYNRALDTIAGKVVLLRASLPATTTLAELRRALVPAPAPGQVAAAPAVDVLAALEQARLCHPNQFTQATYATALGWLRQYAGPALPLPLATPAWAARFSAWLLSRARAASANHYLIGLNALWRRAPLLGASPLIGLFTHRRHHPLKPRYVLTLPELAALTALDSLATRAGVARDVYLAQYYLLGSRVGVILELSWGQVDFERGRVALRAEKGGVWQSIALQPQLAAVLSRYHQPGATGLVFPLLPAGYAALAPPVRYRARKAAAAAVWAGLQTCAGLLGLAGRLHSHTARHTLATHTVEKTGDYRLAQRFLGHSKLSMTENYLRGLLPGQLDAGADRVYGSD